MPREARIATNSKFFHVMTQGIEKQNIFNNPTDMQKYIELIAKNSKRANVIILAYCMMRNHSHILLYAKNINNMIKFFRYTDTSYAKYFNSENNRVGYVFRDRYKSQSVHTMQQLINTINYIHENPIKAGICNFPEEYEYSSYNEYLNQAKIINKKILYKYFSQNDFKFIF